MENISRDFRADCAVRARFTPVTVSGGENDYVPRTIDFMTVLTFCVLELMRRARNA
jgi:hypothetical protein